MTSVTNLKLYNAVLCGQRHNTWLSDALLHLVIQPSSWTTQNVRLTQKHDTELLAVMMNVLHSLTVVDCIFEQLQLMSGQSQFRSVSVFLLQILTSSPHTHSTITTTTNSTVAVII